MLLCWRAVLLDRVEVCLLLLIYSVCLKVRDTRLHHDILMSDLSWSVHLFVMKDEVISAHGFKT